MKKFIEPIAQKKGDPRVLINGRTVKADFRIIYEDNYQTLFEAFKKLNEATVSEQNLDFCECNKGFSDMNDSSHVCDRCGLPTPP
jgi:hypothetical protein